MTVLRRTVCQEEDFVLLLYVAVDVGAALLSPPVVGKDDGMELVEDGATLGDILGEDVELGADGETLGKAEGNKLGAVDRTVGAELGAKELCNCVGTELGELLSIVVGAELGAAVLGVTDGA